jgi:hypothetical protein
MGVVGAPYLDSEMGAFAPCANRFPPQPQTGHRIPILSTHPHHPQTHATPKTVISTEAVHSLIVKCAAEKPASRPRLHPATKPGAPYLDSEMWIFAPRATRSPLQATNAGYPMSPLGHEIPTPPLTQTQPTPGTSSQPKRWTVSSSIAQRRDPCISQLTLPLHPIHSLKTCQAPISTKPAPIKEIRVA